MDKEYQELLLEQLKKQKIAIDSIEFKHTKGHDGKIFAFDIGSVSFSSVSDEYYSISKILVEELYVEILKQISHVSPHQEADPDK